MRCINILLAFILLLIGQHVLAAQRIGVSIAKVDDNFMTYVRRSLEETANQQGIAVQFEDAQGDIVRQLNQVQSLITQKVDALIVLPVDTAATANITRVAVENKIPLVYINRRPDERTLPKGVAAVASDDLQAGELQMKFLAEKMGGKGNLAIILGELVHNSTHGRTEGVKKVLKEFPEIKIVAEQNADWDRSKGMDLTSNWLLAGTSFDAIVANNDEMAIGAAMALRQAGKSQGAIPVVGVDGLPDGLAAIKRGLLAASVFQDPKGQATRALQAALAMIKGDDVEQNIWVPYQLITPEQLPAFEARFK